MSWSGFKKNVGRATTQVMMKTGHVEKTTDREYEVEERRYRTLEAASLRLQKEAKGYLDSLRAMTASQMRIAETIDAFYGEAGARDGVSRSYKQAVEDLDAETVKALDGPYRCVPRDLWDLCLDEETGESRKEDIGAIEQEWNFESKRRHFTRGPDLWITEVDVRGANDLIEFIYRTTVLEPINRFCAYFPDINECIKKRNHKMLDYDAMRSKVKKLVEKPDKDPSKLPRTEKEMEMVSRAHPAPQDDPTIPDLDLGMPSPPKVLESLARDRVLELQKEEESLAHQHSGLSVTRSASIMSRVTSFKRKSFRGGDAENRTHLERPSLDSTRAGSRLSGISLRLPRLRESGPSALSERTDDSHPAARTYSISNSMSTESADTIKDESVLMESSSERPSMQSERKSSQTQRSSSQSERNEKQKYLYQISPLIDVLPSAAPSFAGAPSFIASTAKSIQSRRSSGNSSRKTAPTPFWHPSELELIMQPIKEEYLKTQTDKLAQAKAAYEQLNEQLTNELPQLIDLRVPYLDPTFEALVKIQLRFCAEAYSRMAQVQQYLDASTRDQYANGDLDARVEDVLGQIRELSIAGTV
ncbi:BAR protein [Teratosphaeria destructans]|uniref:BAR protein n=1 Tax=Teratosphaeria destructans TaxID=418781 RepID=A0A9W7SLQ2_9PEZI|nr:BAR protein [Teratosphaeria destructans]